MTVGLPLTDETLPSEGKGSTGGVSSGTKCHPCGRYRNSFKESATVRADTNTTLAATVDPCFES